MDVYLLDDTLHRSAVIDNFESFIWTERFSDVGDFEMVIASTIESRNNLIIGTYLNIDKSVRVMTIETVLSKIDSEGRAFLTITGRSLEALLQDRVGKNTMSNLILEPKWILTGTPGEITRKIFQQICVDGALDVNDIIPFVQVGNIFPPDTIAESTDIITVELDPDSVYKLIKDQCDIYDLGFRLVLNSQDALNFNIYSGNDLTTAQTVKPAVVFNPNFDNLTNVSEFTSTKQYKNIAYVFSKNGFEVVFGIGVNPLVSGLDRHVLMVKADDVDEPVGTILTEILQRRGLDALSQNKMLTVFDGELPSNSKYRYGLDYQLGDLLEMQNANGVTNYMRVTEQIFVSDAEGDRSYPTLALKLFITPGTWYAKEHAILVWNDMPATGDTGFWENE